VTDTDIDVARLVVLTFSAAELAHLAEARRLLEYRLGEERTARLAALLWDLPALGWYRRYHQPPPWPADAPPLPTRKTP
jgi:hypothetical protein